MAHHAQAKSKTKPKQQAARERDYAAEADDLVDEGKLEKAVKVLREGNATTRKRKARTALQRAWKGHGDRFMGQQEWASAAMFYLGGIELFRDGDSTELTATMCRDVSFCLHQVGRLDEAEAHARRSLAMQQAAERLDGMAGALYYLSGIVFERGRVDEAVEHGREAVRISRETGNLNDEAFHLYALARGLYEHGHTHEARQHTERGLEICEQISLPVVQANFLNMLANLAHEESEPVEALEAYELAREIFKAQELGNHAAITTANMGNVDADCQRLEEAIAKYDKALRGHKKAKDERSRAIVLTDRGGVLAELGRFDEAHANLEEALALNTKLKFVRRVSFVRDTMAKLAEARGELEEARAHYAEAEMTFEDVGDNVAIGRMLLAMAGLQADLGDHAAAEALLARAEALDPSMRPGERPADAPPPRAGVEAVRALRELALGRIEVAKARFAPTEVATALRDAAALRLAAVETAPRPLPERHGEVRRVAGRLRAALRRGMA